MKELVVLFLLVFIAVIIATWVAPPFGSFSLADQ